MSRRSLALKRSCIVKSLFKGNKFQYTITNQPQHIKYKQYKPHIEGMQAHYKYSLHMCPSARSSVPHFVKIASPLFKTYYLERTWKANGWHWDLNFEIRGHQKYPHHIDNPHRQPSQFTRIRVCKRHDQIQGAPHWKTMLPAWSSKLSTDCFPLRRADNHQGVLDVAGRPGTEHRKAKGSQIHRLPSLTLCLQLQQHQYFRVSCHRLFRDKRGTTSQKILLLARHTWTPQFYVPSKTFSWYVLQINLFR